MENKPLYLVVEDDEDDRTLLQMACQESNIECDLLFAEDGQVALEVLEQMEVKPSVMLVDINMPRMDGITLLEKLKESDAWKSMPILMLTTTSNPETIHEAYAKGANSYLIKPNSYRELSQLWNNVHQFWMNVANLPNYRSTPCS
ncbi:MAG: response regulator [Siphonobacter sp.]